MVFETISEEELRREIAEWFMENKRSAPLPASEAAEEFINNFIIPESDFEFTQSYVSQSGDITVLFKTAIHLFAWQTRKGKEPKDFSYYKVTIAALDDNGDILNYKITGYVITSF